MKKFFAVLMSVVLCFSLVACTAEKTETVENKVKSAVEARLITYVSIAYDTIGVPNITYYIEEVGENKFEVSGKVTVQDKYGDTYSGNYDAEVEYNSSTDKCTVDYDLGKLYKK